MDGKFYRSRSDRMISGVAGGVAEALRIDSSLVRIAWVILIFLTGGFMLLLYIVMAIVVPEEPVGTRPFPPPPAQPPAPPLGDEGMSGATSGDETVAAGPAATPHPQAVQARAGSNAGVVIGAFLIFIGLWFLADEYLRVDWGRVWPVAVIALGVLLLAVALRRG